MSELLDLEAELAAGEEEAVREVRGRRDESASSEVQRALSSTKSKDDNLSPKAIGLLKRAMKIVDDDRVSAAKAAKLCLDAVDIAPQSSLANHALAICLERLGRLAKALQFYERAWKLNPHNSEVYLNLAMLAWKLDMMPAAEKFLRLFLQLSPNHPAGVINLSGVLRDQGKFEDSIEILRAAIYANPEEKDFWNSLGTTLLEKGEPDQALTFYSEALRLQPDFARAHHNTAFAYELLGEPEKSAHHFREALKTAASQKDVIIMNHGLSQSLLALGELEAGWDLYKSRLEPEYTNVTHFLIDAPRWDGDDVDAIRGKKVLWIGEQGLGDEILFLQLGRDLIDAIGPEGQLYIAVEKRLMAMVQAVYPEAIVGTHRTVKREGKDLRGIVGFEDGIEFDYWTPFAQPARAFRTSLDAFAKAPTLEPPQEDVDHWREKLGELPEGLKVGILWKSLKMDAKRSKHFSAFELWKPVLKTPGVTFVNLQYGDAEEDIAFAKSKFGVDVHTLDGIDLKNDLDQVTALAKACDLVIGPTNATTSLGAAAGGNIWYIHPHGRIWSHMGAGRSPWFPTTRSFFGKGYADWISILKQVAKALAEEVEAAKAA